MNLPLDMSVSKSQVDLKDVNTDDKARSNTEWTKQTPDRLLFDSICRQSGQAITEHLKLVIPVFVFYLQPTQDADLRLTFLATLETLLNTSELFEVRFNSIYRYL